MAVLVTAQQPFEINSRLDTQLYAKLEPNQKTHCSDGLEELSSFYRVSPIALCRNYRAGKP